MTYPKNSLFIRFAKDVYIRHKTLTLLSVIFKNNFALVIYLVAWFFKKYSSLDLIQASNYTDTWIGSLQQYMDSFHTAFAIYFQVLLGHRHSVKVDFCYSEHLNFFIPPRNLRKPTDLVRTFSCRQSCTPHCVCVSSIGTDEGLNLILS